MENYPLGPYAFFKLFINMGNNSSKNTSNTSTTSFYEHDNKEDRDELGHLIHVLVKEIFKTNFSSNIHNVLLDRNTKILDIG